jgi:hypothetical protein
MLCNCIVSSVSMNGCLWLYLTRVICAVRKDVDVVLLSVLSTAICKGYVVIYYLLHFVFFAFTRTLVYFYTFCTKNLYYIHN